MLHISFLLFSASPPLPPPPNHGGGMVQYTPPPMFEQPAYRDMTPFNRPSIISQQLSQPDWIPDTYIEKGLCCFAKHVFMIRAMTVWRTLF